MCVRNGNDQTGNSPEDVQYLCKPKPFFGWKWIYTTRNLALGLLQLDCFKDGSLTLTLNPRSCGLGERPAEGWHIWQTCSQIRTLLYSIRSIKKDLRWARIELRTTKSYELAGTTFSSCFGLCNPFFRSEMKHWQEPKKRTKNVGCNETRTVPNQDGFVPVSIKGLLALVFLLHLLFFIF